LKPLHPIVLPVTLATFCAILHPAIGKDSKTSNDADDSSAIGLILPAQESLAASIRNGTQLGLERAGGKNRLVLGGSPGQWGTDGNEAVRLIMEGGVHGLIAPPDGAATHLLLQVAGRTGVPVVMLCPDASVTQTGIRKAARVGPSTVEEAKTMLNWAKSNPAKPIDGFAAIVPEGRAGNKVADDLQTAAKSLNLKWMKIVQVEKTSSNQWTLPKGFPINRANLICLWLEPIPAAQMAIALRSKGYHGILAGHSRLFPSAFQDHAGEAANDFFIITIPRSKDGAAVWENFAVEYQKRFAKKPDIMAAMAYDAATLLARLLEVEQQTHKRLLFSELPPVEGATGLMRFDEYGNQQIPLAVGTLRNGRLIIQPR